MIKRGGVPEIHTMEPCECADGVVKQNGSCLSLDLQREIYKVKKLEDFMGEFKCTSESCVLSAIQGKNILPPDTHRVVLEEKKTKFLPPPPPSESSLLSNINIDARLTLAANHRDHSLLNLGFSMVDFNDGGHYATNLTIPRIFDIINNNPDKTYLASVLNHDVSSGGGTHWVVILIVQEARKIILEYFNSSGSAAPSRVSRWAIMFRDLAPKHLNVAKPVEYVQVLDRAMQHMSDITECGVYSLYYILARINGAHRDDFKNAKRTQKDMRKYRSFLFRSHK
jgi:hypothetical protein